MTAESSMRLLVVAVSPPETVMRPSGAHSMMAANPPGPGLPKQAPSVLMVTCVMAASPGLGGFAAGGVFGPFGAPRPPWSVSGGINPRVLAVCGPGNGRFGVRSPPCRGFSSRFRLIPAARGQLVQGIGSYGLGTGELACPFLPRPGAGSGPGLYLPGPWVPAGPGWSRSMRRAVSCLVVRCGSAGSWGIGVLAPVPGPYERFCPVFAVAFRRPSAGPAGRRLSGGSAPRTAGRGSGRRRTCWPPGGFGSLRRRCSS